MAVDSGDYSEDSAMYRPRLGRAGGLFTRRVGTTSNEERQRARDRARELAELYASMKAMRYGRR